MNIFLDHGDTHYFQYPSIQIKKEHKGKKPIVAIGASSTSAEMLRSIWKCAFPEKNIAPPKAAICFHSTAAKTLEKQVNFFLLLDSYKHSMSSKKLSRDKHFLELASYYTHVSSSPKITTDGEVDKLCNNLKNLYLEEKSQIPSSTRSKVFKDCATKASAFQAGIKALVTATEKSTLLFFDKTGHSNGVCILEDETAVIKRISNKCRAEEQRLVEQLFFIRNLEGMVPQFFIRDLSRRRFGIAPVRNTAPLSSLTVKEQKKLLINKLSCHTKGLPKSISDAFSNPKQFVGASIAHKMVLNLEHAIAFDIRREGETSTISPVILQKHKVTAQPLKSNMFLYGQLKRFGLIDAVMSRLTFKSQYTLFSLLEMQPLDLHHENIGFEPSKRHLSEELRNNYDSIRVYTHNSQFSLNEYILRSLQKPLDDSESIYITIGKEPEPRINTFNFSTLPWEIVLFDTDHFFFESSALMKIDSGKKVLHQIPLRIDLLETKWAQLPITRELVEKLKCSVEPEKYLKFFEHPKHPVLDIIFTHEAESSAKNPIMAQIHKLMRSPKYSISHRREIDNTFTISNLRNRFENDLAEAACESTKKIWRAIDAQLPESDSSLASDTKEAKNIRLQLVKGIFPKLSLPMIDEYKKRCERRSEYLTDFEKLQNSTKLSPKEQTALLKTILKKDSTPLLRSTRIQLEAMLKKPTLAPSIVKKCLFILEPSFFTITVSMYPILGDVWELLPDMYKATSYRRALEKGAAIGHYMISLEEIVANYLLQEFLPHQHLIADPRILELTLAFNKDYSIRDLQKLDVLLTEQELGYGACHFACKRVVSLLIEAYTAPETAPSYIV